MTPLVGGWKKTVFGPDLSIWRRDNLIARALLQLTGAEENSVEIIGSSTNVPWANLWLRILPQ
jgi:hypothetical protein